MTISYAITVCTELEEIQKLLNFLKEYVRKEDEIVILFDSNNGSGEVGEYLNNLRVKHTYDVKVYKRDFNNDFAEHKNYLNSCCARDIIVNLDADEIPNKILIEQLPQILELNDVDAIWVSRINTVKGITNDHIVKWGWKVNEKGWINFPDQQLRIYKNKSEIKWEGVVHEKIVGYETISQLPLIEEYSLYHPKQIDKQIKQNEFYSTL